MRNRRLKVIGIGILFLMLVTGCSASDEATATPDSGESTFSASDAGTENPAVTGAEASEETGEDPAIVLTRAALADSDWMSMDTGEGRIDLPVNEAFIKALNFETWEPVEDVTDSVEAFRFAVGNGEIVINENSTYLLTDQGMDWYLTSEDVVVNVIAYMEENFTMSARSMLFNDEYMFAEYYHDTIPTLGNLESFDGNGPLVWEMVRYAWDRYTYENDEETVRALYNEELDGYLVSREMAIRECKRYFDFDESATDFSTVNFYLPEVDGFELWYAGPDTSDRSNFQNGWGYAFGGLKDLGNERYEVRLIDYADPSEMRIAKTNVMEIYFDTKGNLKFESGYQNIPSYEMADTMPGFEKIEVPEDFYYMSGKFIGETDQAYFFMQDDGEWIGYNRLDKESLMVEPVYAPDMEEEEWPDRVEQHGDQFFFYTTTRVLVTDTDWNLLEAVPYPKEIMELMKSRWDYEAKYFGHALSTDRSMFAYVDEDGMKLYTIATGETKLIKPQDGEGDVTEAIWPLNPYFIEGDTKIVTARTRDYDSGFYFYDLKTKEEKTVEGYIVPNPWLFVGEQGFFHTTKVDTYFYDFQSGESKMLAVENQGPHVYEEGFLFCNENYATYFDNREEGKDLVLLNLDTWTVEKRTPIENVDASILFLSRDGDVGISYTFTYTDLGIAIMKNK